MSISLKCTDTPQRAADVSPARNARIARTSSVPHPRFRDVDCHRYFPVGKALLAQEKDLAVAIGKRREGIADMPPLFLSD